MGKRTKTTPHNGGDNILSRQERRKIEMAKRKEVKKAQCLANKELREKGAQSGLQEKPRISASNAKSPFKTVAEEQAEGERVAIEYIKTMQQLLPGLLQRLSEVKDFRQVKKIKHKVAVLLLLAIFWFVFQRSSRREANRQMTTPTFLENMRIFFPNIDSLPHHDTVNRFLSLVDINELDKVLFDLINHFIRSKKFVNYLIDNCYPIAIDGTQKFVYNFLWAEECQQRKVGDKIQYHCSSLEASLVFHNGIVLPLASEFLSYMEGDTSSDKQDCETKAFHRLAEKIKKYFPKLKIMVILDGLYPNGPIFERCREYGWQFMIVLQDDSLKSVWEEFFALQKFENQKKVKIKWGNREQEFSWVNNILYTYDHDKKEQIVHVVVCEEQWDEVGQDATVEHKHSKHVWISSEPLTNCNLHERCNLAGRYRWGIENSFLVEKHYGYHYEHAFSFNWNAVKGFHILMRIAHLINTLAQYGSLLRNVFIQKGIQATIKYLDEIFRRFVLDPVRVMESLTKSYQVRFI
jgi:hypothetical protein